MADAQNKLKLQHAHATNALNYGHLGNATYAESSTVWNFMRDEQGRQLHHPAYAFPFEIVGSEFEASQSEITGETAILNTGGEKLTPHGGLRLVAEELYEITHKQHRNAKNIPFNDGSFERVPHKGQLAFGSAAVISDNGKSRQTVPIAALVSGITAEAVRILLIGKKNFQTVDAHGLHNYQLPTISYDEEAYWSSEGDPVQQVCFAATCDSETTQGTWMATRCRSGTTIFHPLFYRAYMTLGMSATRLSPNPILRIPMSRTGGHPHADVAFHPYDHKLLAIVDVHGNWSVWKIEIPRRPVTGRVLYGIHLQSIGRLFTDVKLLSLNGDWHKICWISHTATNSDRLMVSSRSHAALFDSSGHNLGDLDLRTGGPKENQLVLDIEQSSTNPMECYFLTSTKLLLMSAAESDQANSTGQEQMIMLLSWSHYRGRTDSSLRLVLAETAQGKSRFWIFWQPLTDMQ